MPFLLRELTCPKPLSQVRNRSWLHPLVRASAVETTGCVYDSALLPTPGDDERLHFYLTLSGSVFVGRALRQTASGLLFQSHRATFDGRFVAFGEPHKAVALRLEKCVFGEPLAGVVEFSVPPEIVEATFNVLRASDDERSAAVAVSSLLSYLRSMGFGIQIPDGELLATIDVSERDLAIAHALTNAMTLSGVRATKVDFSSVVGSERQLQRVLGAFFEKYKMPFSHWREVQQSFALTMSVLLMTAEGAETRLCAQMLGYASSAGLCHALSRNALPSPQQIGRLANEFRRNV